MLRVCLTHQHEAWYVMQSLIRLGHHDGQITWPRYESIGVKDPKDTTIHCPVQELNRESTTLRLPTCAHILKLQDITQKYKKTQNVMS